MSSRLSSTQLDIEAICNTNIHSDLTNAKISRWVATTQSNVDVKAPPAEVPALTSLESRFLASMFQNMTTRPDANWDQVAADLNLKDAKCAKERFRQMSKKHCWGGGGTAAGGGVASPAKSTGGTSTKKKDTVKEGRVKKEAVTPIKGKKTVKSEVRVKEEEDEAEDDGLDNEMPGDEI